MRIANSDANGTEWPDEHAILESVDKHWTTIILQTILRRNQRFLGEDLSLNPKEKNLNLRERNQRILSLNQTTRKKTAGWL